MHRRFSLPMNLDWDNSNHYSVLKQIANGKLYRLKHGAIDPVEFGGLIVGATNDISIPRGGKLRHLAATLDRFRVVHVRPSKKPHDEMLQEVMRGRQEIQIDFEFLSKCLRNPDCLPLTEGEEALIENIWRDRSAESLDGKHGPMAQHVQAQGRCTFPSAACWDSKTLQSRKRRWPSSANW